MNANEIRARVSAMMPEVIEDLTALSAIPSVAFPGFPAEPVFAAADATVSLFRRYGVPEARLIKVADGYPAIYADIPGPPGAPTVLMYGHYDVQPAPVEQGWETDPFQPVVKDGRLYGRGAADDKSGVLQHAASLRVFDGKPPVGVKILIEGEEETTSHIGDFVRANPEDVRCDVFIIADLGNTIAGEPQINTTERGDVSCTVEVRTLHQPVHSGKFGGAAPDALMALILMLSTLVDADGSVAVPGVSRFEWTGADFPEDLYRSASAMLDSSHMIGTGTLSSRLWSHPSVTVIGMDVTSVRDAANVLIPVATAKISMRIVPGSDADHELDLLMEHLRAVAPWGATVDVKKVKAGQPFRVDPSGPAFIKALEAMSEAFERPATIIGSGASIPLLHTLEAASPGAEFILWGAQDVEFARIHGANESVDLKELEGCTLAQALFLNALGES